MYGGTAAGGPDLSLSKGVNDSLARNWKDHNNLFSHNPSPFMKKLSIPALLLLAATLSGCELAGDIFRTGFNLGIIVVVLVIVAVIWLVARLFGGRRG